MSNHRTPAEIKAALDAIVAELRAIDAAAFADADLVPLAKAVESVTECGAKVGAIITARVITEGRDIPGAARKPGITHRRWNDAELAAELAFKAYGLNAFKLESPAALEKLGEEGKALVAVASFKPPATDRVVY